MWGKPHLQLLLSGHLISRFPEVRFHRTRIFIRNQLQEDLEYDQMTLNEYIDPFTGEPVQKGK